MATSAASCTILEGHLALQEPRPYTLVFPSVVGLDQAPNVDRAEVTGTGLINLGHCIHHHTVTARADGGGSLLLSSEVGFLRFRCKTAYTAATRTHTGRGEWGYQKYTLAVADVSHAFSCEGGGHAAAVKCVAERMEHALMLANAQASAEEQAALALKGLPWGQRRRLPMHYTTMLWSRARQLHQQPSSPAATLGRLNPDVLQNVFEFLSGMPFRVISHAKNTWGSDSGAAAPIHFVEHTGRYLTDVHCRVMCGGVYVRQPSMCTDAKTKTVSLGWSADTNGDSLRGTKPAMANIRFSADFARGEGNVQFPGEGPIGYILAGGLGRSKKNDLCASQ